MLYERLAGLLPREFADEYAPDLVATFEARARDARGRGRLRYGWWYARELASLLRVVTSERSVRRVRSRRRVVSTMDKVTRELAHASRRLLRTPGFALAAVLTLAVAIGANAAIFTLVQRVVLAPLPYATPDRLIALDHAAPGLGIPSGFGMSTGLYREYRELPSLESAALYMRQGMTLSGEGTAEQLDVLLATPSLAAVLGSAPALGRWFHESEGERGAGGFAVLSHALWQDRFGGDAAVIGRRIRLDGMEFEIVGVMPADFAFQRERAQLILPLQLDLAAARPGGFNFGGVGRLAPGATLEQARREQNAVIADLPQRFPDHLDVAQPLVGDVRLASLAIPLKEFVLGDAARMLWVLLGSVAIVLLIACANIANLFLVRTDSRQREVAVRQALGADRAGIASYFMAETLLVCAVAGTLGLGLSIAAVRLVRATELVNLPRLHEVVVGSGTILFVIALTLIAGVSFGMMPLLRRLPAVAGVLQDAGRGNTVSGRRMRVRQALMGAQVALAVMVLIGAGLLVRSFDQLRRVDPGFDAESRLTFRIGLSESLHRGNESTATFHESVLERLRQLPGVQQVAVATTLPLQGDGWGDPVGVRGRSYASHQVPPIVRFRRVSGGYFDVVGIPLVAGRTLDRVDDRGLTNVAVVNEAFAAQYFPGEDPIGQQILPFATEDAEWLTIVGIVGNTATYNLRESNSTAKLYLPLRSDTAAGLPTTHTVNYVIRTAGHPLALVPSIRTAVAELDPHVALARAEPLADLVTRSQQSLAFTMVLLVTAALVALLLGIIGVYAVISYGVAQRRGEIGVRIALGAQPVEVTRMIVRQSGVVIALGVVAGLAGAAAATRLMSALLFGVARNDALTYSAVALGLFVVAIAASWLPARRAARVDPLRAL